ncbi:MAG: DsrE family protein [Dehalococcoidia bacterium]|jgi:predicted peroxiredoxin|nr:DsrE family protein [Dehalococcoidia bacterium]
MASVMFVATHASDDPTKATLAVLATVGGVTGNVECSLAFVGEGVSLIKDVVADNIHGVGFAPFSELMSEVVDAGVPIYV